MIYDYQLLQITVSVSTQFLKEPMDFDLLLTLKLFSLYVSTRTKQFESKMVLMK